MNMERYLEIKWSVSRGFETYGYNICTLYDNATGKRYRTMGGGYDMLGTVVGDWLQDVYQDCLRAISDKAASVYHAGVSGSYKSMQDVDCEAYRQGAYLYGMTREYSTGAVTLDGACGINSVEKIAAAAGINMRATVNRKGHVTGYMVSEMKAAA